MITTMEKLGIHEFSMDERLALAEAIWDSVAREAADAPITPAQRTELERRLADSTARPEAVTAWEVIKSRALARAKR